MNRTARLRLATAFVALAPALAVAGASAQPADPQATIAAQTLYDQAMSAIARKDYASACPKLEEVVRLVPEGVGAKLTLAECYEGQGRLASAWTTYALAQAAAARGSQADRRALAHERATLLRPKLAELTIAVPDSVQALPGIEIRRDGVVVGRVQWNVALPVDTGKHVIEAAAEGRARWQKTIEVAADGDHVAVAVEGLERVKPAEPSPPPARSSPEAEPAPAPRGEAASGPWPVQKTMGLVAGGLGLVGIGVGAIFGVTAIQKKSESNNGHCRADNRCDVTGLTLRQEGLSAATGSSATFIAGGVALAAGVVLFATAPKAAKGADIKVGVGLSRVELLGRW